MYRVYRLSLIPTILVLAVAILGTSAVFPEDLPRFESPSRVAVLRLSPGEPLHHEFSFRNAGTGVLEIENIKTSCGCVYELVSSRRLAPGDSGTLRVSVVSTSAGVQSAEVYLITNDPANRMVSFSVKVDKTDEPMIRPAAINLGSLRQGQEFRSTFEIHARISDATTLEATLAEGWATATLAPKEGNSDPNSEWVTYAIVGTAQYTPNSVVDRVLVKDSATGVIYAEVPVRADVQSKLTITPTHALLGIVRFGEPARATASVTGPRDLLSELHVGKSTPSELAAELSAGAADDERKLTLKFDPRAPGAFSGIIPLVDRNETLIASIKVLAVVAGPSREN